MKGPYIYAPVVLLMLFIQVAFLGNRNRVLTFPSGVQPVIEHFLLKNRY
jgi:hypothetical protein